MTKERLAWSVLRDVIVNMISLVTGLLVYALARVQVAGSAPAARQVGSVTQVGPHTHLGIAL